MGMVYSAPAEHDFVGPTRPINITINTGEATQGISGGSGADMNIETIAQLAAGPGGMAVILVAVLWMAYKLMGKLLASIQEFLTKMEDKYDKIVEVLEKMDDTQQDLQEDVRETKIRVSKALKRKTE